jgi:hypothetical protein
MLTETDVANMALGLLVEAPIESLEENTKAARLLSLHFETTRMAELTKHAWAFSIFREEIDEDDDAPTSNSYDYGYTAPTDALRILPLTDSGEAHGASIPWKMEGSLILTSWSGPRLVRYIANLTDPNDWSPLFIEAFTARLAMKTAMPLTGKAELLRGAQQAYLEAITEARRVNAIEVGSVAASQSWTEARGDYGYSDYRPWWR